MSPGGAPVGGKVAPDGAEGLGEGAHHDVHVSGVDAGMLADAAAGCAHRADAVRLVQVEVRLRPTGSTAIRCLGVIK